MYHTKVLFNRELPEAVLGALIICQIRMLRIQVARQHWPINVSDVFCLFRMINAQMLSLTGSRGLDSQSMDYLGR
jgi:hypothetical protein